MPAIFKWASSYFHNKRQKWEYGILYMNDKTLWFAVTDTRAQDKVETVTVSVPIENIVDVKREITSLIFSSVTLKTAEEKHWFSSFSKPKDVFTILRHFWQERLDSRSTRTQATSSKNELFKVLYDSQDTLSGSAKLLHNQGEELRQTSRKVAATNNDLEIAEKFVKDLNTWSGLFRYGSAHHSKNECEDERDDFLRAEYAILVANTEQESHKECILTITANSIEFKDKADKLLHSFLVHQISRMKVHSQWDLTLVKTGIGIPSIRLHVISTRLQLILQTLECIHNYKPMYDYKTVRDNSHQPIPCANQEPKMPCNSWSSVSKDSSKDCSKISSLQSRASHYINDTQCNQEYVDKEFQASKCFTDEDAAEVSSVLSNMKSLALDISKEQDKQLKEIHELTCEVEKTSARVHSSSLRVSKLT